MLTVRRLESIDLMRGLVMVLMALDHTRDFFSNVHFDPTDLNKTTVALFLTRWITHFCAPTFILLTGISAYLTTVRRQLSNNQLARYLITRGLWLVLLELTLVRFGWKFNWDYHYALGQVIWALGWSMVALAGLIYLPRWLLVAFCVVTIAGHNVLDGLHPEQWGSWAWLWHILHVPGKIEYLPGYTFFVLYPLIPWIAVMAAGYCLGPVFLQKDARRKTSLLCLGWLLIFAFMVLRLNNLYGDEAWSSQKSPIFTVLAVLNCDKYPPSLHYLLMTLGPMFLGLVWFEQASVQRFIQPLLVFGRVPLLFYLIHLPVIHGAAMLVWSLLDKQPDNLVTVYVAWLSIVIALYWVCAAYAGFKQRNPHRVWLSYL